MQIYLRNLAKVKWKIETYILIFQTQNVFTKRINVQSNVDFIKDGTSNVPSPNYFKIIIILEIFLLMDLETKPTTFYHHTLKCHNTSNEKIKQEKVFKKV
jgi:hypothetical protein